MKPQDYSRELELHSSASCRLLLAILGTICVIVGLIGVVLPILPTTPFMLLAAWCYMRSSRWFYNRIMNNKVFGPILREWRLYRSIPRKAKKTAMILMPSTFAISILFFVPIFWVQVLLSVMCLGMLYYIWRIPVRDVSADSSDNNTSPVER